MHRIALALLGVFSTAVTGCRGVRDPAPPASSPAPKLVVLVVVDQLSTWAFERDRAQYKAGFARLLRDGAYVRAGEIPYANPFTAPGHATIGTGAPPSVHGILGNTWYRRDEGKERPAEFDRAGVPLIVGPSHGGALEEEDSASSRALRVDGIADALRAATGGRGHSVSIALKPRAAVFMTGRAPDLAVWYEPAAGGMTTSAVFAQQPPPWLVQLARERPGARFFQQTWVPLDPAQLARATGIPDNAPGEGSVHGLDATFPHELANSDNPGRAVLHTPFADELVMDAVLAALSAMKLGEDDIPDLLAVSFNAHDYAGHVWGPDSWEVLDLTLRLDVMLGDLFDTLDRRVGPGAWSVVLTSDHGVTPVVERGKAVGSRRIRSDEIARAIEDVLAPRIGSGPWVAKVASGNIYFAPAFAEIATDARSEALAAAARAVGLLPGIAAAGRVDQIAGRCEARTGLERALCYAVVPGESGDLYVVPALGSSITNYTSGTHHDAPFDDNRQVPILVMAPNVPRQTGSGSLLQVTPTLAALLRIPTPTAATQPPLFGLAPR